MRGRRVVEVYSQRRKRTVTIEQAKNQPGTALLISCECGAAESTTVIK